MVANGKPRFMTVHLYDADGSSHPEVDVKFYETYEAALEHVRDVCERRGGDVSEEDEDSEEENEWATDDGWIRIDETGVV